MVLLVNWCFLDKPHLCAFTEPKTGAWLSMFTGLSIDGRSALACLNVSVGMLATLTRVTRFLVIFLASVITSQSSSDYKADYGIRKSFACSVFCGYLRARMIKRLNAERLFDSRR